MFFASSICAASQKMQFYFKMHLKNVVGVNKHFLWLFEKQKIATSNSKMCCQTASILRPEKSGKRET